MLHAARSQDFKTAYTYFREAFEVFDNSDDPAAWTALQYMLLTALMVDSPQIIQKVSSTLF